MALNKIFIHQFRNYSNIEVELSKGRTLIYGENGQGKTNFIEAVFLLLQGYSFRTHKLGELIPWNAKEWLIRASMDSGDDIGLQFTSGGEKNLSVNGVKSHRFSDLLGKQLALAIGPNDIELSQGGPAIRRRFLDAQLCQFDPKYLGELRLYQKSLKQRNAFLKSVKGRRFDKNLMSSYTEQLANHGVFVLKARQEWLFELSPKVEEFYHWMSLGKEPLEVKSSRWTSQILTSSSPQEALFAQMMDKADYDQLIGSTSVGPHKDDFVVLLKNKPLREFGSQGQQRSFALSLKLGTAHWIRQMKGENPILLLDDIFAELDTSRRQSLVEHITGFDQVLLTTPEAEKGLIETDHVLKIEGGKVTF